MSRQRKRRTVLTYVDTLLDRAERNVPTGPGAPNRADLSRSVSDAYYAIFHYVGDQIATQLLGASDESSRRAGRYVLARSPAHNSLASAMSTLRSGPLRGRLVAGLDRSGGALPAIPVEASDLARVFLETQQLRYAADYDWTHAFRKEEVVRAIENVRSAVAAFDDLDPNGLGRQWFLAAAAVWDGLRLR